MTSPDRPDFPRMLRRDELAAAMGFTPAGGDREVDFTFGLDRFGDVQVVARVSRGRPAPLPTSERARLDPGDSAEVEVLAVRAFDEHSRAHEVLPLLTDEERERVTLGVLEEAARLEHGEDDA